MHLRMMKAKLHRVRVTEAQLDYVGSITVDPALLEASGIHPHEMVQITNMATGALWQTYVLPGPRNSGVICLNGPPARHFQPGDEVIVLAWAEVTEAEAKALQSRVVFVDEHNRVTDVKTTPMLPPLGA
ncbi:MAG TPA: aspartate 1-decarboxylase [Limnochordia bacterium]|nr:aspartate 1-decarboxylase [Limnochordia bacterium]